MSKCSFKKITQGVVRKGLIILIDCYRYLLSPFLGSNCRFVPSCSEYAKVAIEQFGVFYGGWLTLKRLLKCHPWHSGGYDPVPPYKK
jgi:uncharacterized protein